MSEPLTPSIITPTSSHAARATLAALGLGLVGAALMGSSAATAAGEPAFIAPPVIEEPAAIASAITVADDSLPTDAPVHVVVRAGGVTYMVLAELDAKLPKHGTPALVMSSGGYPEAAVASVRDAAIAKAQRAWRGRTVQVIGAREAACTATVTDFAIVSRLVGEPAYAGLDTDAGDWTAATMFEHGQRVLAAKLDDCADGVLARDARLPAMRPALGVASLEPTDALAATAMAALIASPAGAASASMWSEQEGRGAWHTDPTTTFRSWQLAQGGRDFVVVHASSEFSCGMPAVNALGVYVHADGRGLVPVSETVLEGVTAIEGFADLDGDGAPELFGRGDLGLDSVVFRADGEMIEKLELPFFGCPC